MRTVPSTSSASDRCLDADGRLNDLGVSQIGSISNEKSGNRYQKNNEESSEIKGLKVEIARLKGEVLFDVDGVQKLRSEVEADIRLLKAGLRTKEAESTLKIARAEMEAEEALTYQISLKKQITNFENKIEEYRKVELKHQRNCKDLEGQTERLKNQENSSRILLDELAKDQQKLKVAIRVARTDLSNTKEKSKTRRRELEEIRVEHVKTQKEVALLVDEHQRMKSSLNSLKKDHSDFSAKLVAIKIEISDSNKVRENDEHLNNEQIDEFLQTKNGLVRELADLQSTIEQSQREGEARSSEIIDEAKRSAEIQKENIRVEVMESRKQVEKEVSEKLESAQSQSLEIRAETDLFVRARRKQCDDEISQLRSEFHLEMTEKKSDFYHQIESARKLQEEEASDAISARESETIAKFEKIELEMTTHLAERTAYADEVVCHALQEADQMRSTAKEEVMNVRAEAKLEVETIIRSAFADASESLRKANAEAEEIRLNISTVRKDLEEKARQKAEEYIEAAGRDIARQRKEVDEYVRSETARCNEDIIKSRDQVSRELASLKVREVEGLKAWKDKKESEFEQFRRHETSEVIRNLEVILNHRQNGADPSSKHGLGLSDQSAEVLNVVRQVLNRESPAPNMSQIQNILPFNPKHRKTYGDLFTMRATAGLCMTGVLFILFIFPGYWSSIGGHLNGYIDTNVSASDEYVDRFKAMQKEKSSFKPMQTSRFKSTYLDNVLYTKDYLKITQANKKFQREWTNKLHEFITAKIDLDERIVVKLLVLEAGLVKKLARLRRSIHPKTKNSSLSKMRKIEKAAVGEIRGLLGGIKNYNRFRIFREDFYRGFAARK